MSTNINGYCPQCKADLDGEKVMDTFLDKGYMYERALESAKNYAGWKEYGEDNRWGRAIGLSNWDSVYAWRCPDCSHVWKRFE